MAMDGLLDPVVGDDLGKGELGSPKKKPIGTW